MLSKIEEEDEVQEDMSSQTNKSNKSNKSNKQETKPTYLKDVQDDLNQLQANLDADLQADIESHQVIIDMMSLMEGKLQENAISLEEDIQEGNALVQAFSDDDADNDLPTIS